MAVQLVRTETGVLSKGGRSRGYRALALALACLIPTVPLLLVEVPGVMDYPNHLARMWFLGTQAHDPVLSRMLEPHWALLPNLGVDLVLPWVMRVVPPLVAGRMMLAVLLVLPVLGVVALSRATFGPLGLARAWALGAGLVTCNALFLFGFLNFNLSIGLAMLAGAGWFVGRVRWPWWTMVAGMAAGVVLFFCHLMGVAFFLLLASGFELERCWALRRAGSWRQMAASGAALAVVAALPMGLYLATALRGVGGESGSVSGLRKAMTALYPVVNYDLALDLGTAAFLLVVLGVGFATGRLVAPMRWVVIVAVLAGAFLVSPGYAKGLAFIDARFSVMLGFCLFAGVRPVRVPKAVALGVGVVGVGLLVARTAVVGMMWQDYAPEVAAVREAIGPVEAGARVLTVYGESAEEPPGRTPRLASDGQVLDEHVAAFLMLDRHAFWPRLFADPAQQPVRWLPPYRALAEATPGGIYARYISGEAMAGAPSPGALLYRDWPAMYDYVLMIEVGGAETPPNRMGQGRLALMRRSGPISLYRVRRAVPVVLRDAPVEAPG